jgi:hypothetical protein
MVLGIICLISMAKTAKELIASGVTYHSLKEWLAEAPISELDEFIKLAPSQGLEGSTDLVEATLHRKAAQAALRPHWSITPGLIVGFLAMIFAAIAAWPVIQGWLPTAPPLNKAASFQSPQSNSVPATAPTSKTTNAVAAPK